MKRIALLCLTMAFVMSVFFGCARRNSEDLAESQMRPADDELWEVSRDVPALVTDFTDCKVYGAEDALQAIGDAAFFLGVRDVRAEFPESRQTDYLGTRFYSFDQYYEGIPVFGRGVTVAVGADNEVLAMSQNYKNLEGISTQPEVEQEAALSAAEAAYGDDPILSHGLCIYSVNGTDATLAWRFQTDNAMQRHTFFISASTGQLLDSFADAPAATARGTCTYDDGSVGLFNIKENEDGTYSLEDPVRNIRVYDADGEDVWRDLWADDGTVYREKNSRWVDSDGTVIVLKSENGVHNIYSVDGVLLKENVRLKLCAGSNRTPLTVVAGTSTQWDSDAAAAMDTVADIYDMFALEFNRNGFNGSSGETMVVVNAKWGKFRTMSMFNAYSFTEESGSWTVLTIGKHMGISINPMAHEYAHSVEQSISHLLMDGEPRSIMEAMSDVFGELAEDWTDDRIWNDSCNWVHDEPDNLLYNIQRVAVLDGKKGMRVIHDPNSQNYAIEYGGKYFDKSREDAYVNSTVISHACYRMVNPLQVNTTALTNRELGELLLYGMHFLPQDCDFHTFAASMRLSAELLGYSRDKQQAIIQAFHQVNISPGTPLSIMQELESLDYLLAPVSLWRVFDANGNQCLNYRLIRSGQEHMGNLYNGKKRPVSEEVVSWDCNGPVQLELEPGYIYRLEFSDKLNPNRKVTLRVGVVLEDGQEQVNLLTDFTAPFAPGEQIVQDNSLYISVIRDVMEKAAYDPADEFSDMVNYGWLEDVNGDNIPELMLVYHTRQEKDIRQTHLEVWSRETGAAVRRISSDVHTEFYGGEVTKDSLVPHYFITDGIKGYLFFERQLTGAYYVGPLHWRSDSWRGYYFYFYGMNAGEMSLERSYSVVQINRAPYAVYTFNGSSCGSETYSELSRLRSVLFGSDTVKTWSHDLDSRHSNRTLPELLLECGMYLNQPQAPGTDYAALYGQRVENVLQLTQGLTPQEQSACQGYLQDLNGDSILELMIQYIQDGKLHFEIWTDHGEGSVCLYASEPVGPEAFGEGSEVRLVKKDGRYMIMEYTVTGADQWEQGRYRFIPLETGAVSVCDISCQITRDEISSAEYTVDGMTVDQETYRNMVYGVRNYGPLFQYRHVLSGTTEASAVPLSELPALLESQ